MLREDSSGSDAPVDPVAPPEPSQHVWPSETDLLLVSGSNKVLLTIQRPLMRAVFQDTFERIRAAMVSQNAFPNVYETLETIKECLIKAAASNDGAMNIHNRLLFDTDYADRMARLVSLRILNRISLTCFSASCPRLSLPRRGQGSLRRPYTSRIFGSSFKVISH
jgi:hypothetical protein